MNKLNPKFAEFTDAGIKNAMLMMKAKGYTELGNFTLDEITEEWQSRAFNAMSKFMAWTPKEKESK